MNEEILDQVKQVVADVFNVPFKRVTTESSPETIKNWDSLQYLNLVVALEQNFGIQFMPEEIEQMIKVETIGLLIQKKLSK